MSDVGTPEAARWIPTSAALLTGMEPMEQILRDSGQYGPRVAVPDAASVQDRLVGFIGRDPAWQPPAR